MALVVVAGACGKQEAPATQTSTASAAAVATTPSGPGDCPANGLWAECSVMRSLARAGIAPRIDSTATPEEKALSGSGFVVTFGAKATSSGAPPKRLEVYLYPDSNARIADETKLDKTKLVSATAPQTINRERTLIENANLLGLLTSIDDRLRERVSDALTAGAPQPSMPVTVKP
jgi:hypothetical protein